MPHHLVIDRCYLHGNPTYGHRRGLALNSGDATIINSHFSDFKGVSQDTQAIMGWNGPGPFLIENNHLEAAGENIMFGGTDPNIPNLVPTGITIRRNLITKPIAWMSQSWTVKNLIEFKNAKDVIVEGNTIENNWAAGQQGYSILFTPRNQSNTAPWVIVKNVTIQNNVIRHVAAVFNILGYDDIATSRQTQDITIRNNLIYDVSTSYATPVRSANGRLAIIGSRAEEHHVRSQHGRQQRQQHDFLLRRQVADRGADHRVRADATTCCGRNSVRDLRRQCSAKARSALNYYTPNAIVLRNTFAGATAQTVSDRERLSGDRAVARRLRQRGAAPTTSFEATSLSNNAGTDGKDLGRRLDGAERDAMNGTRGAASAADPRRREPGGSTPYSGTAIDAAGHGASSRTTTPAARTSRTTTRRPPTPAARIAPTRSTSRRRPTRAAAISVGWTAAGEWLNYTVNVSTRRHLRARRAHRVERRRRHVPHRGERRQQDRVACGTRTPAAGRSGRRSTKTGVTLAAGPQMIRVVLDTIGPSGSVANFNWLAIR